MRFPPGDPNQYAVVTTDRESDPDVVVIRAFAGASLRLADCERVRNSTFKHAFTRGDENGSYV